MVDGNYVVSLLGCANLIELTLLAGGLIAVCIASANHAELVKSYSHAITHNESRSNAADLISVYDIDVYTIKYADQVILIVVFILTFLAFLAHIFFALRYRYAWHRLSIGIAILCIIYAFALFCISVLVSCWEDQLRKRFNHAYLNSSPTALYDGSLKPRIGSAAAAATFGFAACLAFLAEALIRFRRLADKIPR